MHATFFVFALCALLAAVCVDAAAIPRALATPRAAPGGFTLPLRRREVPRRAPGEIARRGAYSGTTGLGDFADLFYSIPVTVGGTQTSLNLDTGSSDLFAVTPACAARSPACSASTSLQPVPLSASNSSIPGLSTNPQINLQFGDSATGTHAAGKAAAARAAIAGLSVDAQAWAAVDDTDSSAITGGSSGILGMGFFSASVVQAAIVNEKFNSPPTTDHFIESAATYGPLATRLALSGQLEQPMFAVMLQRNTLDPSGGDGEVSVGRLPDGVDNSSLTWVPVRLYESADGGLNPPNFAPNEVYPLRWEVPLDAVFVDGKRVENDAGQGVTALLDTGNSILRGPAGTVTSILDIVSPSTAENSNAPTFPCAEPHTLEFSFGGKRFPVDPRDFASQNASGDATTCVASKIVSTDAPGPGALFSWSLGDPFFRSTLVAFYFGNLTHPSVDPPRIGFLSTVPANATAELQDAVSAAQADGGNFESTSQAASTAPVAASSAGANAATTSANAVSSSAASTSAASASTSTSTGAFTPAGSAMVTLAAPSAPSYPTPTPSSSLAGSGTAGGRVASPTGGTDAAASGAQSVRGRVWALVGAAAMTALCAL